MEIWQAIVLGAVQGFTEFLPVSSSGHLLLLGRWLGVTENGLLFSVMLHLGTLIPVVYVFFKEIKALLKKPLDKLWLLVLATIPAGIVGLTVNHFLELDALFNKRAWLLGVAFLLTATELLFAQRISKQNKNPKLLGTKSALTMGVGQALAIFPGLSRSGTTLFFGQVAGLDRESTANFTFLMSVPIILSAVFLEGVECIKTDTFADTYLLSTLFGVITSAVTGYLAVKLMLRVIKKANYLWFSVYLFALGLVTVIGGV